MTAPYTIETLKLQNPVFVSEHELLEEDVELVNSCVASSYTGLDAKTPKVGDSVRYTEKDGTFHKKACIADISGETATVCLNPFIPFVSNEGGKIEFFAFSGGPFIEVPLKDLVRNGTVTREMQVFSLHTFTKAHSALLFNGYVTEWTYKEPGLRYGEYTTEHYNRITIIRYGDGPVHIVQSDMAHVSYLPPNGEISISEWIAEIKGVVFHDSELQTTIFGYKEIDKLIPERAWDMLDLPISQRGVNGPRPVPVKLKYDDERKHVIVFRYKNN